MSLIEMDELGLELLIYWNEKLKGEINRRIAQTLCPYCTAVIGTEEACFCPNCGGKIEWMWED